MSGHDELPKKYSTLAFAGVLIASYLIFAVASFIFVGTFGPIRIFELPEVIIVLGINYLTLTVFPLAGWRMMRASLAFLGLSKEIFFKTLPVGVVAFFIAGAWQFILGWNDDITLVPDRPLFLLAVFVPLIALVIPLIDMKYAPGLRLPIGVITLAIWSVQAYLFPVGDEDLMNSLKEVATNILNLAVLTFLIGIYVPFIEEFFFRGFILNQFSKKYQPFFAIFLTAALFGFAHLGSPGIVSLALFAIPMGMLSYFNKSIYPAVWAHAGLNLSAMAIVWLSAN